MKETLRPAASRRSIVAKVLPLALITLAACTPQPQNPSAESEFLQNQLVPAINSWAKSNAQELRLFEIPAVRSFEYLCVVQEYQYHSNIESEVPSIKEYRGRTGPLVPEMRTALIGIKGRTAHVGYLGIDDLSILRPWKCYMTNGLVLKLEDSRGTSIPHASMEERSDYKSNRN